MSDAEFLLSMLCKGWRLETDCGPWVQFVQDRFEPHEQMPPIAGAGYVTSAREFERVQARYAKRALAELRAAKGGE
jgi:hypothetical protein